MAAESRNDPEARARELAVRRIWDTGGRCRGYALSPARRHWVSRGFWPTDRMLPPHAIRWVPRLTVPEVEHGLPTLSPTAAGVMLYGFAAPEAAGVVRALRAVPLSGDGTPVADGFRPPDASPQPRWSLSESRDLGVCVRNSACGAVLIAGDVASALALSLIYSEQDAGVICAAVSADAVGTLACRFDSERSVFVFPDDMPRTEVQAIRHTCREAGGPRPEIRRVPGGKSPADALAAAVRRESGGALEEPTMLAVAFQRALARTAAPLQAPGGR